MIEDLFVLSLPFVSVRWIFWANTLAFCCRFLIAAFYTAFYCVLSRPFIIRCLFPRSLHLRQTAKLIHRLYMDGSSAEHVAAGLTSHLRHTLCREVRGLLADEQQLLQQHRQRLEQLHRMEADATVRVRFLQTIVASFSPLPETETETVHLGDATSGQNTFTAALHGATPPLLLLRLPAPVRCGGHPELETYVLPGGGVSAANRQRYESLAHLAHPPDHIPSRDPAPAPRPGTDGVVPRQADPLRESPSPPTRAESPVKGIGLAVGPGTEGRSPTPSLSLSSQELENFFREMNTSSRQPGGRKRRRAGTDLQARLAELQRRTYHEVEEDGRCLERGVTAEDLLSVLEPVLHADKKRTKDVDGDGAPPGEAATTQGYQGLRAASEQTFAPLDAPPEPSLPSLVREQHLLVHNVDQVRAVAAERSYVRSRRGRLDQRAKEEAAREAMRVPPVSQERGLQDTPPQFWSTLFPTPRSSQPSEAMLAGPTAERLGGGCVNGPDGKNC
eukprot:gene3994-2849_t